MKVFFFVALVGALGLASSSHEWRKLTSQLSGHSEAIRLRALKQLRAIEGIQGRLEAALLGPERFHALEAISAMNLTESVPKLKELAAHEGTGAIFLTINSLTDSSLLHEVAEFYMGTWERQRENLSNPSLVVVLDTLGQMSLCVSESALLTVWKARPAEVRLSILDYVDGAPKRCGTFQRIYETAKKDMAIQVRERVR